MEPPKNTLYEESKTQHTNIDDYEACNKNINPDDAQKQEDLSRNVFEKQEKDQLKIDIANHDAGDYEACKKNINPDDAEKQEDLSRNVFEKQEKEQLRFDIENHDAGVYNEAAYNKKPGCVQETLPPPGNIEGENREVVEVAGASGSGDDGGVRITTVARMTYELDRYSKNAMLIINYDSDANSDALKIKNVFEKYRFEVEYIPVRIENDLTNFISDSTAIAAFFEKDFTNYGALAVFVIQDYKENKIGNTAMHEWGLLSHFRLNIPASLKEKPIIIFKEHHDVLFKPKDMIDFPNILQFQYRRGIQDIQTIQRLVLHKLLDKINDFAGDNDLLSVFNEASRDCMWFLYDNRRNPLGLGFLPYIYSTLHKEIRLARSPL